MKKLQLALAATTLLLAACNEPKTQQEALEVLAKQEVQFTNDEEKIAYGAGFATGRQIKEQSNGKEAQILAGIVDALTGKTEENARISMEELTQSMNNMREKAITEVVAKRKEEMKEVLDADKAFVESFSTEEGVQKTESGLLYKKITENAEGEAITNENASVKLKYALKDSEGNVIDAPEEEIDFTLSDVVPGFAEAVKLMKTGEKMQAVLPSNIAYGDDISHPLFARVLVFDIDLISIENPVVEEETMTSEENNEEVVETEIAK